MVFTRQMTTTSGHYSSGECSSAASNSFIPPTLKLTRITSSQNASTSSGVQSNKALSPQVQSTYFMDLPQEVMEKIFSYLTFKNVSSLRPVSRRINSICCHILNSTFFKLQTKMLQRFQEIKSQMPRRESARRGHYLAYESDIIETLHMRLTLLQMTFGKHMERKHMCFFPGGILDEVYLILYYIKTTPKLDLPYKVTDELFDLSTMAMEYFKEKIEPSLPGLACFSSDYLNFAGTSSGSYRAHDAPKSLLGEKSKSDNHNDPDSPLDSGEELVESMPIQSNMVLRKRIRKIKQGMKLYNSQLSLLRQDLRLCKKKTSEQQKQILEQQRQMADQQNQTHEYASRLDEYDKKNEEISRKFSTLLQELNKCKTELQYWRCKSPATPQCCTNCGNPITPRPEELQALLNQGVDPEVLRLESVSELIPIPDAEQGDSSVQPEENAVKDNNHVDNSSSNGSKENSNHDKHDQTAVKGKTEAVVSVTANTTTTASNKNILTNISLPSSSTTGMARHTKRKSEDTAHAPQLSKVTRNVTKSRSKRGKF